MAMRRGSHRIKFGIHLRVWLTAGWLAIEFAAPRFTVEWFTGISG